MSEPNKIFKYGVLLGVVAFFIGIFAPIVGLVLGFVVVALGFYSRRFSRGGGLTIIIWGLFIVLVSIGLWWYYGSPFWELAFD